MYFYTRTISYILTCIKVLLLVYVLYLLFQLKSHAYMYESTPQHLIDEESHPGVLAEFMNSSSSSDSSSTSDSDTDSSSGSHTTAKRFKRAFRRRRKSSVSSKDTGSMPSAVRTPSSPTNNVMEDWPATTSPIESHNNPRDLEPVLSGEEADDDRQRGSRRRDAPASAGVTSRDFQHEKAQSSGSINSKEKRRQRKHNKKHSKKHQAPEDPEKAAEQANGRTNEAEVRPDANTRTSSARVGFATPVEGEAAQTPQTAQPENPKKKTSLFSRPALPKVLSTSVFSQQNTTALPPPAVSNLQQDNRTLRRTSSLPDRLNSQNRPAAATRASGLPVSAKPLPHLIPQKDDDDEKDPEEHLSRTSAVCLLLISTGLVAICAEFLVDSIDYLVSTSGVSQAFVGLIILPIVGNAAEHVTAVTVAAKNKMDLAIGVALGSSIQIALFVTPLIVLLGWCLDTDMSLYFSLFETVSLFASAFIVNYLMIDGRSNYLEGALLIASYVIIAVAAFFYPSCENLSGAAGPADTSNGSC